MNETAQPAYLTVKAAVAFSGINRTRIFQLLSENRIRGVKAGRQTLLKRTDLESLLESLPAWRPRQGQRAAT